MKKDNDLFERPADEEEDLFDLSLDDLEPEDTIVEAHIDEHDDEIIELMDLVQKGDIDLGEEEDKSPDATIFTDTSETADEELRVDETLDLLDIPLDEEISFDEFEDIHDKETDEVVDAGHELNFFIGDEQSSDMTETPLELFIESPLESVPNEEAIANRMEPLEELSSIEDSLIAEIAEVTEQPSHEREKTVAIFPEEKVAEPLFDMKFDELEQLPGVASELIQKEQEAKLQQLAAKSEMTTPLAPEPVNVSEEKIEAIVRKIIQETMPVIVEEKINNAVEKIIAATKKEETPPVAETAPAMSGEQIEAILRKVVEETVPGIAEDKITVAVEKIIQGTKREETPAAEAPLVISEEKIEEILRKLVEEVVARVTRETMAGVAERVITDAINALQKSIETASE
jgi:hypothetical protein